MQQLPLPPPQVPSEAEAISTREVRRYEERIETLSVELESLRAALALAHRREEVEAAEEGGTSRGRSVATEECGVQVDGGEEGADAAGGGATKRVGVAEERRETSHVEVQTEQPEETARESRAAQTDEEVPSALKSCLYSTKRPMQCFKVDLLDSHSLQQPN